MTHPTWSIDIGFCCNKMFHYWKFQWLHHNNTATHTHTCYYTHHQYTVAVEDTSEWEEWLKNECASVHELGSMGACSLRKWDALRSLPMLLLGLKRCYNLFHKHFEHTWLVVLIRILVWVVVQIQPFINCMQLQGFPIDFHTFVWVRRMIIMFNHTLRDLMTV